MKLKGTLLRNACYRYIQRYGPQTTEGLLANARLWNGKLAKDSRQCSAKNTKQLANIISKDSRFTKVGMVNVRTLIGWKEVTEWGLNENEEIN